MLREGGFKVGLYTSPHLSDFRERIRILKPSRKYRTPGVDFEGLISKRDLVLLINRLKPAIQKYNAGSEYGPLSFFEVYTALAFVYFKEKKTDFVVLETGLGGRLDATNVVDPLICAITPISYEHTQKLGNTLRMIAGEKAGIIKRRPACPAGRQDIKAVRSEAYPPRRGPGHQLAVVSAPQEKEALKVIRNRCKKVGAKLYEVGKDINLRVKGSGFRVQGPRDIYVNLKTGLLGRHQLDNAAVAIGAIEALRVYNIEISHEGIRKGLYDTIWPGRLESVGKNPAIILDGAQNIASAAALKNAIKGNFRYKRLILVFGISKDKDIKGVSGQLWPLADNIILTRADNPRAAGAEEIEHITKSVRSKTLPVKTANVKEAVALAKRSADKEDLILVTGSLFAVGEARELCAAKI